MLARTPKPAPIPADLDLSKPSYRAAFHFARKLAAAGDRPAADALMARLLWLVPAQDGGFIGLSDAQLTAKVRNDARLNLELVLAAQWAPGTWPSADQVAA